MFFFITLCNLFTFVRHLLYVRLTLLFIIIMQLFIRMNNIDTISYQLSGTTHMAQNINLFSGAGTVSNSLNPERNFSPSNFTNMLTDMIVPLYDGI